MTQHNLCRHGNDLRTGCTACALERAQDEPAVEQVKAAADYQLLPCPNPECRSTEIDAAFTLGERDGQTTHQTGCMDCGTSGPDKPTVDEAAAAWNRMVRLARIGERSDWQPIETAPKDGEQILLRVEHRNAVYSDDPVLEGWVGVSQGYWTDFNGGGWVWNGLAGRITHWMPLPEPPK